ncbi:MAG: hypothetical protein GXO74_09115 [Calditrichaeota bacterium]|nr:hypothetical protein [Calditrichota bacterium]
MNIAVPKLNRIILYFLSGIVLPCIILAYFALRGIRNDTALTEKKIVTAHQRAAKKILAAINEQIRQTELAVRRQFFSRGIIVTNFKNSAWENNLDSLPWYAIFTARSDGEMEFLHPGLLFFSDDEKYLELEQIQTQFPRADYFEFQTKEYNKAITIYRSELTKRKNKNSQGVILLALARLYRKNNNLKQAHITYRLLSEKFKGNRETGEIPLNLIAGTAMAELRLAQQDTFAAADNFFQLFENLTQREWYLTRSEYFFYLKNIKNSLDNLMKSALAKSQFQSKYDSLNAIVRKEKLMAEKLLAFETDCRRSIAEKIPTDSAVRHLSLTAQNREYFLSLLPESLKAKVQSGISLGILWDEEKLIDRISTPQFRKKLALKNSCYRILGKNKNVLFCSENFEAGKMTVRTNLVDDFPPWTIEFYQKDLHLFENFLKLRRSIYLYSFLLIAGILGFGLVLTSISITREIELAKLKSDFVSTISHELRSPLTSIRQLAEMLQRGRVPTADRKQKYYDVIVEQSEKLSLLINNILDFSKIESKKRRFDFELIDFGKFLAVLLISPIERLQEEGFKIETEIQKGMPKISIDRAGLAQVINNLLDNAAKYSDKRKKIIIRCYREKSEIIFSVQDFGIGIPADEQGKIFDKFYRSRDDSVRTKIKGSGLGLTLVKLIVEAHRGKIDVVSEVGKGSTFKIKLPILN